MSIRVMTKQEYQLFQETTAAQTGLASFQRQCACGFDGVSDALDQANHAIELATNYALQRLYYRRLSQLKQVRTRISTGQYGICESCNTQISPDRLDLVPHATLCVKCQRRVEQ